MGLEAAWSTTPASGVVVLSREIGQAVVTTDDEHVGRLADLTVRLDAPHPLVHRLVVRAGLRSTYLLPWADVVDLVPGRVRLRAAARRPSGEALRARLSLEADELLLGRDVMDTQVVDLEGHRLSRVSDVLLVLRDDGSLELAAVDVGMASTLRRAGLGWLARDVPPVAVDWQDLHLTSRRGHAAQLSTTAAGFRKLDAPGLAELLTRLSTKKATDLIRHVEPGKAAAAVHRSHPVTGRRLMHALGAGDARRLMEAAPPGQAEHLVELGRRRHPLHRRRFRRTAGWRVRRPRMPDNGPARPPES